MATSTNKVMPSAFRSGDSLVYLGKARKENREQQHEIIGAFSIQKVKKNPIEGFGNELILSVKKIININNQFADKTIESLLMSFSIAEAGRIVALIRTDSSNELLKLTKSAERVIRDGIEFPMGNALKLLINSFSILLTREVRAVSVPNYGTNRKQWEFFFELIFGKLQEEVMRSAYYAANSVDVWRSLCEKLNNDSSLSTHQFLSQRIEGNAGPPKLSCLIPFERAVEVVSEWQVKPNHKGVIESAVLNEIKNIVESEQKRFYGKFPKFPGGLLDEL